MCDFQSSRIANKAQVCTAWGGENVIIGSKKLGFCLCIHNITSPKWMSAFLSHSQHQAWGTGESGVISRFITTEIEFRTKKRFFPLHWYLGQLHKVILETPLPLIFLCHPSWISQVQHQAPFKKLKEISNLTFYSLKCVSEKCQSFLF